VPASNPRTEALEAQVAADVEGLRTFTQQTVDQVGEAVLRPDEVQDLPRTARNQVPDCEVDLEGQQGNRAEGQKSAQKKGEDAAISRVSFTRHLSLVTRH
jgi:hypothetical protein